MQAEPTESATETTVRPAAASRLFSALRYQQYRNYWFSSVPSMGAQQITLVAQGWLIYDLTDSPLYLAYAGLITALPGIGLSLVGGVMADRMELKKLLGISQVFLGVLTAGLATLVATGLVQPGHVLVFAFLNGCGLAFNNPARQAIYPLLVDRDDLMNAVSLNSMSWQGTRVVAPSFGGLFIAFAGVSSTFYLCTVGYVAFALVVFGLKYTRAQGEATSIVAEMRDGLGYVLGHSLFAFLIGLTFFNSFFGISVLQIFPVFAKDVLDVGPTGLGIMFSAVGVGSVSGLIIAGLLGDFERKGLLIVGGAIVYGSALVLFSQSALFPLSLFLLFFVGAFSQIYMISVQTTLQLHVPDELRGRVMGIYTMTYNMGPLGALQAGVLADVLGASAAVGIGGSAIILFALMTMTFNAQVRGLRTRAAPAAG